MSDVCCGGFGNCNESGERHERNSGKARHFHSIPRSMLALMQFINLDSIAEIYVPLMTRSPMISVTCSFC